EVTKAKVFGLPSARFAKLRLNERTIVFFSCFSDPARSHIPIHGPHALVKIVALRSSKVFNNPSRSAVKRTCSEPGLIPNSALVTSPFSTAWRAIDAARDKSSYEELVHEPINPHSTFVGQPFLPASSRIREIGVYKSGVNGPFNDGSNSDKLISIN